MWELDARVIPSVLLLMQENTRERHAGASHGSYPVSSYLTFLILLLWFEDHPGLGFWGFCGSGCVGIFLVGFWLVWAGLGLGLGFQEKKGAASSVRFWEQTTVARLPDLECLQMSLPELGQGDLGHCSRLTKTPRLKSVGEMLLSTWVTYPADAPKRS